ncbi:MAG: saccharopine dehydrogenase NADP-binding domain-containing protein [Ignavibacteriaceae bacterium]|nr:saccharopine dehydrogenase NADP-binding domain-containing protein [Ignavibacteriaceae bacterium]
MKNIKKIIVLGCGLVGKTIAIELCRDYNVTAADIDMERLKKVQQKNPLRIVKADLSDREKTKTLCRDFDLVISAVPGFMGFLTLEAVIEAGKDVVDISFFGEDPFELNELAIKNNVTAIVDCGVAPGMSNIILGYYNEQMKINSFECYVGGLPLNPKPPFNYRAPFSPSDVIEEYLRPARFVEDGKTVVKDPLSDSEIIDFGEAGKLEAFYTDGLRSLLKTMNIRNMKEKTLRFPGHIQIINLLKQAGFFDSKKIEVSGNKISPLELTSKILFSHWKLEEDEKDFTVLRLIISDDKKQIQFDLYDKHDTANNLSSMSRTTGYTCAAAARLVLENEFKRKGICPPEFIGREEKCYSFVMNYLKQKNINYIYSEKPIDVRD